MLKNQNSACIWRAFMSLEKRVEIGPSASSRGSREAGRQGGSPDLILGACRDDAYPRRESAWCIERVLTST